MLMNAMRKTPVEYLPKIGIRPVIDGRRNGVRESLEEPIMSMARSAERLISAELRHSSGEPVACVIPDYTIGGAAEAARCAELFRRKGVGAVIDVTRCWCYAAEILQLEPSIPYAVWGFNGTKKPGAVYLAGASAAGIQMGIPVFKIYGRDVQDEDDFSIPFDVREQLLGFVRAACAVSAMRGRSYLSMGGVSMGIAGSMVDHDFFRAYLGMRSEYVDMTEFVRRIDRGIFDADEYGRAARWVGEHCLETEDPNPPAIRHNEKDKRRDWEISIKMALVARDLMVGNPVLAEMGYVEEADGHNALAAGFQGQRQWTDHLPTGDFMEAILNSSFDWNGAREPHIVATENDALNAAVMLFGKLLTGTAQIFADVRTYWSPEAIERVSGWRPDGMLDDGFIYLTNSGAAALDGAGGCLRDGSPVIKPFWKIREDDVERCLGATRWGPAKLVTFRGGGYSSAYRTPGGLPITMSRLSIVKGIGPVLQTAEGFTIDLPPEVFEEIVGRTDPTWPRTFFVPRLTESGIFRSVYSVMRAWGANHCALCYGHVGSDLITLAAMLRIPVAMHNISYERLFRPSAWDLFGTADPEAADYRACAALGPLYGSY